MNQESNKIEAMKSKEQIKKEATEAIKNDIKEIAEENFLKKSSSLLFKDIIQVFKKEMIENIYEFVKNLESNEEIQMFFKSIDILEPDKEIKIAEDFKKYKEILKEIEKNSYEKSLRYVDDENMEN